MPLSALTPRHLMHRVTVARPYLPLKSSLYGVRTVLDRAHTIRWNSPPPPIDDSTSALDYKTSHKVRPPPLPKTDLPRSRSAEEAVTNILYNTPPPSLQPYKIFISILFGYGRVHVLYCLVQNEPGVLSRVSGILAGRGFNIDSLVVCRTEIWDQSRMCIAISGQDGVVEHARRQLEDLTRTISRELLLVKVSILGPEYLEDQLEGGPSHEPRAAHPAHAEQTKLEREMVLARHFEESTRPPPPPASEGEECGKALTPSEALRRRHQHLHSLHTIANQFGARLVDVSDHSVIVEMTGKTTRVEAFLALVKPFGIIESARTGLMAMPRTHRWVG
ncbi:small subunit of acetolactate synthase-domain-containing protein [Lactarius deliciosus]|nr:small subunit of acetolactate synthase-domain-containing protein [Lactarius deliciosus]